MEVPCTTPQGTAGGPGSRNRDSLCGGFIAGLGLPSRCAQATRGPAFWNGGPRGDTVGAHERRNVRASRCEVGSDNSWGRCLKPALVDPDRAVGWHMVIIEKRMSCWLPPTAIKRWACGAEMERIPHAYSFSGGAGPALGPPAMALGSWHTASGTRARCLVQPRRAGTKGEDGKPDTSSRQHGTTRAIKLVKTDVSRLNRSRPWDELPNNRRRWLNWRPKTGGEVAVSVGLRPSLARL